MSRNGYLRAFRDVGRFTGEKFELAGKWRARRFEIAMGTVPANARGAALIRSGPKFSKNCSSKTREKFPRSERANERRSELARVYACASTRYQYPYESPLYFPPLHHCRQRFAASRRDSARKFIGSRIETTDQNGDRFYATRHATVARERANSFLVLFQTPPVPYGRFLRFDFIARERYDLEAATLSKRARNSVIRCNLGKKRNKRRLESRIFHSRGNYEYGGFYRRATPFSMNRRKTIVENRSRVRVTDVTTDYFVEEDNQSHRIRPRYREIRNTELIHASRIASTTLTLESGSFGSGREQTDEIRTSRGSLERNYHGTRFRRADLALARFEETSRAEHRCSRIHEPKWNRAFGTRQLAVRRREYGDDPAHSR